MYPPARKSSSRNPRMFAYPHWKSTLVQSLFPGSSSLFRSIDPTGHWLKSQPQTIAFVVRLKFSRPNPFVTVFSTEPVPGYNSNTVKVTRVEYNIERKSPAGKTFTPNPYAKIFWPSCLVQWCMFLFFSKPVVIKGHLVWLSDFLW